ncbi:MAG: hypothetical protein ABIR11_07170 [Candidatus Limnocylindrales bacterium]
MARVKLTQHAVEVLVPTATFSPTTVTGAGISQDVVEVLGSFEGKARAAVYFVEVLVAEDGTQTDPPTGGGSASVHVSSFSS